MLKNTMDLIESLTHDEARDILKVLHVFDGVSEEDIRNARETAMNVWCDVIEEQMNNEAKSD